MTLLRKIRPFNNSGVDFCFEVEELPCSIGGPFCFFSKELLLLTFFAPFCPCGCTSLQQRMIFWNRKTWYSRSMSDFVTVKTSSRSRRPKFSR